MINRLLAAGALTAKVQRPNYANRIYKGGIVTVSVVANGYDVRYESPEVPEYLVRAFPAGEEAALESYMLVLADAKRWRKL